MGNHTDSDSDEEPKDSKPGVLAEIWDMAWIPVLLALLAILLTWVVWYNTTEPGKPDSAKPTGCSWSDWEKCISLNLLNKMFTHGAIAGGTGGVYFYIMLRRERLAREAAERRAERAEQRVEQERRQADAERQMLINRILELTAPSSGNSQEQAPSESA